MLRGALRAWQDIAYLEVCILSEICANGHAIFQLGVGEPFHCDLVDARFNDLARILQEPAAPEPPGTQRCTSRGTRMCT